MHGHMHAKDTIAVDNINHTSEYENRENEHIHTFSSDWVGPNCRIKHFITFSKV